MRKWHLHDLISWPNLLSLTRIPLGLLGMLALRNQADPRGLAALAICAMAALTDWLDGLLARRNPHRSSFGIAVDPLADKIFAALMVIGLMHDRGFPAWLAVVVIGRDLLIVGFGAWLMRRYAVTLPSNLAGKYAFASLLVLLLSYIVRFPFGIGLFYVITLLLLIFSFLSYVIVGIGVLNGRLPQPIRDTPLRLLLRVALASSAATWYLVESWRYFR